MTWTKDGGNPIYQDAIRGLWCPFVMKNGSTYYLYYTNQANGQMDRADSADGLSWAGVHTNIVYASLGNRYVWIEGATWYMLYEWQSSGTWRISLATSSDGLTWHDDPASPVMLVPGGTVGGPELKKVGERRDNIEAVTAASLKAQRLLAPNSAPAKKASAAK